METKTHGGAVRSICFSPDGNTLASADDDGKVRTWSFNGKRLQELQTKQHGDAVRSICFSLTGKILASIGGDGKVKLWNFNGRRLDTPQTFQGHRDKGNSIRFSSDGKTLASASHDGMVKLWSIDGLTPENVPSSLDDLLEYGRNWVRDYLRNNPNVSESNLYQ